MLVVLLVALAVAAPDTGNARVAVAADTGNARTPEPAVTVPVAPDSPSGPAAAGVAAVPALSGSSSPFASLPAPRFRVEPADTPVRRPRAVEYSDAYGVRLKIHKIASYTMLPLFAAQYYAGTKLLNGEDSGWARTWHPILASGVAGLFAINTVTGVWNMIESRKDPSGRTWRTIHGVLMLVADAGFAATGLTAGEREGDRFENRFGGFGERENEGGNLGLHRGLAIGSMGVALASYIMMLPPFRRD
ncbi:MAG TPA: hypothetical protein VFQ38_09185 [Longimicrobiales bacterium]|nr:hypothetical protein [Longimicrobiales bacterium]